MILHLSCLQPRNPSKRRRWYLTGGAERGWVQEFINHHFHSKPLAFQSILFFHAVLPRRLNIFIPLYDYNNLGAILFCGHTKFYSVSWSSQVLTSLSWQKVHARRLIKAPPEGAAIIFEAWPNRGRLFFQKIYNQYKACLSSCWRSQFCRYRNAVHG